MKEMVAGVRVTGRTDNKLKRALNDTERGLVKTGKTATSQSRIIERASQREQRATKKTSRATSTLARTFDRAGASARKYGQKLKNNLKHLRKTAKLSKTAGKGLDALDNRYTGIVGGIATTATVMQVGNIQERFTRLAITAGITEDALSKLKEQVYAVARADDIRVSPDQIIAGIDAIVEKTGDLKFAQDNMRNLGLAIQATGSEGLDVGQLFAEFQKMGITAPKDVMKALDTINVQGKEGAFTLKNLASLGPRVITAYTSTGRGGVQALREMGAALQVIERGAGNAETSATAFEAVLRTLTDPAKIKKLEGIGIELFDSEKLAEGKRVLRPINELMKEIIATTRGDKVELGRIFDAEAIRAFNDTAGQYQKTGGFDILDKLMAVEGDGTTTRADAVAGANTINSTWTVLGAAWERFVEKNLTAPLAYAASAANSIGPSGTDAVIGTAAITALGIGGLLLGRRAKKMFGKKKGKGGKGSALENVTNGLASSAGITPVEVLNWPGGSSSFGSDYGDGNSKSKSKTKGRKASKISRAARSAKGGRFSKLISSAGGIFSKLSNSKILKAGSKVVGKAAMPVSIALNAVDLVGAVSSGDTKQISSSAGGMAGSAGGALAGAAIGSVVPIIGTAIGGIIGAVLGGYAGEFAGEEVGGLIESYTTETSNTETHNVSTTEKESVVQKSSESSQTKTSKEVQTQGNHTYNFHITQQAGQSAKELAREVAAIIKRQNGGALYDGV